MRGLAALLLLFSAGVPAPAVADQFRVAVCACDHARPETLAARSCALCREAEKQPADVAVFFLKDINPAKPNRWLALPRRHEPFSAMTAAERAEFWTAAIAKARALFGGQWAIAVNGPRYVTQCHPHAHLGKLLDGVETADAVTVTRPEDIVAPADAGLWIHPVAGGYHVHVGDEIAETVLLR